MDALPPYFTRTERAAVHAPLVATLVAVGVPIVYGWLSPSHFAWSFAGVALAMPACVILPRIQRALIAQLVLRHCGRIWQTRLLPLLVLLLLPVVAHAQVTPADVLGPATSLSTLPAAQQSPLDAGTFAIFQPMAEALLGGIDAVVAQDAAALIGVVMQLTVPVASLVAITIGLAEVFGVGHALFGITKFLIRFGVVMSIVGTLGDYTRYVIEPGLHLGDQLMATVNATAAGPAGHLFDVLMAHMGGATVMAVSRLTWSVVHPGAAMESGVIAMVALGCYVLAFIALALTFIVYLAYAIYTAILLAVGPLLAFGFIVPHVRGWAWGWVSAVASQVLGQLLLGVVLSIVVGVENRQLDAILVLPDANNTWGTIGHLAAGVVVLIVGCGLSFLTRGIAVGIVGGVYTAMDQAFIGVRGASSVGSMATSGSSGGGYVSAGPSSSTGGSAWATPAMAIPRHGGP